MREVILKVIEVTFIPRALSSVTVLVDEIPMYWTKYNMDEQKQQDDDIVMTSGGLVGARIVSPVEGRDRMDACHRRHQAATPLRLERSE